MLTSNQITILKNGGTAVLPTGSVYGLVASTSSEEGVEKVYALKNRNPNKPSIILAFDIESIVAFGVDVDEIKIAKKYWPGMVSIVFNVPASTPDYLHRGTNTLAFRIPPDKSLRDILREAGPLIAPSANPQGEPPATSIEQARKYFGHSPDFYVDGGICSEKPSKVIRIVGNNSMQIIRE